ncbi:unnamed protein product [Pedinophyceae sp. YPF-701]|nr:unnamed protein product [Pedinophyceae sp. YPF-701]
MADDAAKVQEGLEGVALDEAFATKKKSKANKIDLTDLENAEAEADTPAADVDLEAAFDLTKKKKKTKKKALKLEDEEEGEGDDGDEEGEEGAPADQGGAQVLGEEAWQGTDRDITYDELLGRVYGILRVQNPELTGEKRRTILKPPQVAREGTKKTVFTNFADIVKQLQRSQDHVIAFILAELGTSGSVDGQQRLVVRGRFLPRAFENVLRKYMIEYVMCSSCKSPDTHLDREQATRLMYMRCNQCNASRTVAQIKTGFAARVTSRRSERA